MTQDEIIEMARQVYGTDKWNVGQLKRLEAFAKLVAAKEREACIEVTDSRCQCAWGIMARGKQS